MASAKKATPSDDQIVREVMKKYGNQIDLKTQPYVLTEILRTYGRAFDDDGGSPPGGTPPPPPPGPTSRQFDNEMLFKEIQNLGRQIKALAAKLGPASK